MVWAEQHVESGAASVFVAAVPLWAAFFDALWPGGTTVFTWRVGVGLALGFLGSALLAGVTPGELLSADLRGPGRAHARQRLVGARHGLLQAQPDRHLALRGVGGADARRRRRDHRCSASCSARRASGAGRPRGLGALAYLIVFGSIVGFTAYAYALRHASATVVGTYAYVNPVVAVLLGWLILHEAITPRTIARDGADPGRRAHDPARARRPRKAHRRASGRASSRPAGGRVTAPRRT